MAVQKRRGDCIDGIRIGYGKEKERGEDGRGFTEPDRLADTDSAQAG